MDPRIRIRKAVPADCEPLFHLINRVWRSAYAHIFPEQVFRDREDPTRLTKQLQEFPLRLTNPNIFTYVATVDNQIIGTMSGYLHSNNEHYQPLQYAELGVLYIHTDWQHQGLGQKFLEIFINEIQQRHIYKFVVGVLRDNQQGRAAYEKWGGQRDDYTQPYTKSGFTTTEVFYTFNL